MELLASRASRVGLALATLACLATASTGTAATRNAATPQGTIDPALRAELARDADGRAAAVVTTWSAADLARVERLGVRGTKLRQLPMLLTRSLTSAQLAQLARAPFVRSVYANTPYRLYMEDTTWITRARYAWATSNGGGLDGLGTTGRGVDIAVIDTGADGRHEDMDNLVEFCESQQAATGDHTSVLCSPFNAASGNAGPAGATNTARGDATDDEGHGSHVIGTVAGSGSASGGQGNAHSTIGIAPEARIHSYSANVGPSLLPHEILASYDDMINKKVLGLSQVVAVSNSWGGGDGADYSPNDPTHVAIKKAYDAGILSVFAAGNSGFEHNTLSRQCVSPWVLCVAATTKPDSVVAFSSKGRPSAPADTNRDGVVGGPGDIAPGNHDRALGQALELGLYRPGIAAPGTNINSISANSAACRESSASGDPQAAATRGCYEPLNGTSMATPHVSGAVALVVQAFRDGHGGSTPTPGAVTDILERAASLHKLPGWEAEEQGAGRLDAYDAVRIARTYPRSSEPPNLGYPTPPAAGGSTVNTKGCTGTGSWSVRTVETPLDPVGQPPLSTQRFAEHLVQVAPNTERLRATIDWPRHPSANLYARWWRPGVDPDDETATGGRGRVFADQEAVGLLGPGNSVVTRRLADVRQPEAGTWTLRVYHRAGGAPLACDADSTERPKLVEGFNYNLKLEQPLVSTSPSVAITSPAAGTLIGGRWATISGTATYPEPWEGVTNWEVAGSGTPATTPEGPDNRLVLHFQGNTEEGCTGVGTVDLDACDGPFLREDSTLSLASAAKWPITSALLHGTTDRTPYDPSWVWRLTSPTTISGEMTVQWWGSCPGCAGDIGLAADWRIRLWADGVKMFEQRITAGPSLPNVAEKLETTVNVPTITARSTIVLHVDPVYIDIMNGSIVYYDSQSPCPTASGSEPCDSLVRMPVVTGTSAAPPPTDPANVRVTDMHSGLRIAWDAVPGAVRYEVFRSRTPESVGRRIARTESTSTLDSGGTELRTSYYRIVAVDAAGGRSLASEAAYGARSRYDRLVRVKVDRLYGPQYWEFARLGNEAGTAWSFAWDTAELAAGEHDVAARSFTQGVGSSAVALKLNLAR